MTKGDQSLQKSMKMDRSSLRSKKVTTDLKSRRKKIAVVNPQASLTQKMTSLFQVTKVNLPAREKEKEILKVSRQVRRKEKDSRESIQP